MEAYAAAYPESEEAYQDCVKRFPEGKRRTEAEAKIAFIDRKFLEIR